MTIGEKIKINRQRQGLSQAKLGELLSLSQQAVAKWEKSFAEPDTNTLKKLADLFGVSVDYLVGHELTTEEKNAGIGRHKTHLSDDEWRWLELRSEVLRTKGEDYLNTLITMIEAVTKT